VFQGRKDQQVKMRGHRIELGEIETVLENYPDVGQAVVIPNVTADGETNLSAYLVPRNGGLPALEELRNHLKQTLPAYMLPATFTILPTMPMTANLKIDRDALPMAGQAEASTEVEIEPPTDLERTIRDIWKRLLTLDRVNKDDNFFDLGGHSLQLVRLRSELRKATGHDVPVVDLFRHTTIRSLATLLAGSAEPGDGRARFVQSASRLSA
jgi:acyl carrier protein